MKHNEYIDNLLKTTAYIFSGPIAFSLMSLNLDAQMIALYVFLMVIDFITGVIKANILNKNYEDRYLKPSSYAARRGFISKFVMLLFPLTIGALSAMFNVAGEIGMLTTSTLIVVLALAEAFSILGNILVIRTGEPIEESDAVSYVLKQLRIKIFLIIDRILGRVQ